MTHNSKVLAYIKAFQQQTDIDSIRNHFLGKYSSPLIFCAKDVLQEGCGEEGQAGEGARRSSCTHSQELTDLDDILAAFNVVDDDKCLPEIVHSADDLQMPRLLPLHGTQQVVE